MKKFNTIIAYILLLNTFVCCHKNGDNTYFNGNIRYIEDVKNETNVTLKAVPVEGANYGTFAVYDSLMIFWNSKLPNHFFNIFNLNTGEEMGSFCEKGGGPDEMFSVGIISRFYKEKNNLKTLLFAPNENKLFIWNISQSVKHGITVIDTVIHYNSRNEYGNVAYNHIFLQNEDTLFAKIQPFPLNEEEATLPYYQKRTLYSDKLLQNYDIYKKAVRNGEATILPEFFFSSHDVIKPDGSKIVQVMGNLSQINILDTHTSQVTGYRMKNTPDFLFFETTMISQKPYYIGVQASDNYIYASYWGKEPWGLKEIPFINTIYVFDWNGRLIHKLITDQAVHEFWLDSVKNRLYTTDVRTDEVFYLDLDELGFHDKP